MRTDILELHEFYRTALGGLARDMIAGRLEAAWGKAARLQVGGFGYANPYLETFSEADRTLAFAPGAQGAMRWPPENGAAESGNRVALVNSHRWPLPDASLDRILVVHGLEEAPDPHRLMREIWRVLTDDGRVIIVASHRRGAWSVIDSTPFAAGRPYLKRQLNALLEAAMFRPVNWDPALFFPPFQQRFLLRSAEAWERAGSRLWPGFGGVIMVEAQKDLLAPVGLVRGAKQTVLRPALTAPQPVRRARAGAPRSGAA